MRDSWWSLILVQQRMVWTVVNFTLSIPPLPDAGGNTIRELGAVPGIRPGYTGVRYTFITKPMSENFPNVLKCNCCMILTGLEKLIRQLNLIWDTLSAVPFRLVRRLRQKWIRIPALKSPQWEEGHRPSGGATTEDGNPHHVPAPLQQARNPTWTLPSSPPMSRHIPPCTPGLRQAGFLAKAHSHTPVLLHTSS